MTVTSGFYNSLNGDRKYNAEQLSSLFDGIITDGIFMSIGTALIVAPNTGFNVSVGVGRAWFKKSWLDNDSEHIVTVDAADVILNRIDAIVIEINSSVDVRLNTIKYIKGTAATNPVAPTLTNTDFVHQYPLAYISIPAGVSAITGAMITNKVGTTECPFISGVLESVDASTLLAQFQSEFDIWFDAMKDQLTTDAAGNLQTQINTLTTNTTNTDNGLQTQVNKIKTKIRGGFISNPQAIYLQRAQIVLMYVPAAIHISKVLVRGSKSDATGAYSGYLKYADDISTGSFANATQIVNCSGAAGTYDSGAINAAVPTGKWIYLELASSPIATCKDITIHFEYTTD